MLLYEAANEINLEEERLTYEAQEKYYSDAIDDAEVSISIYLSIYLSKSPANIFYPLSPLYLIILSTPVQKTIIDILLLEAINDVHTFGWSDNKDKVLEDFVSYMN